MKRIKRLSEEEETGAIGIGTLIVFIGLILVAAIASAVIVGVMGDLQERAKRTGRETQENVAPPIKVQHAEGFTEEATDAEMDNLRIAVSAIEGSKGYDLENLLVQVEGEDGQSGEGFTQRFVYDGKDIAELDDIDGTFEIRRYTTESDDVDTETYLNPDEIVALNITGETGQGDIYPMSPSTDVTMKFMPAEGATATVFETVTPSDYPAQGWFELP